MVCQTITFKIETNGLRVEVAVLLDFQASVLEDGDVVSPSRVGNVDCGARAPETRQELPHYSASSGPGKGLD